MENQNFEPLFTFISKENDSMKFKCNNCKYTICTPSKTNVPFEEYLKHHISEYHSEKVEQYQNIVKNNEIMAASTSFEQNASVHEQDIDENKSFQAPKLDKEKSTIVPLVDIGLTDMPKSGGAMEPLAPLSLTPPVDLYLFFEISIRTENKFSHFFFSAH